MNLSFRTLVRNAGVAAGFLALWAGISGLAVAGFGPTAVPEIDPGSMVNALLVLSGGLFIVNGRRPTK